MGFKMRMLAVAAVGVILQSWVPQALAAPLYYAQFWAREDGHLKMWWTKQGVRVSENPFVDNDYIKFTWYSFPAPAADINDADQQWTRGSGKTSETNALAGLGYAYDRFEDYLVDFGSPVTWFTLQDQADLINVSVQVDLVAWGDYLRSHTLPGLETVFLFDVLGRCPELPGYVATNLDTQDPFSGPMVVAGLTSLVIPEPATMSLLALGGLALIRRRRQ